MAILLVLMLAHPAGATDPHVTQANIHRTICVRGYATSVRPSSSFANALKRRLAHGRPLRAYQLDHLIPLELGGAPRALANLWLEPVAAAHRKDRKENSLHASVCAGRVTLRYAQRRIIKVA